MTGLAVLSAAQMIPAATFLYLEGQLHRPVNIRFEGFPAHWKVASCLPQKQGAWIAADYDTLVDSPFEVGVFRSRAFQSGGTRFEMAFTGAHNGDEGRILVLSSGTEPLVRVMAEATTQDECDAVCARIVAVVEEHLG